MIAHMEAVNTAQIRVVSFLYFNPGVSWPHDFLNEKSFTQQIFVDYFNVLKKVDPQAFAKLWIKSSLNLDYCTPAQAVNACIYLMEYRLAFVFYEFFKKQDLKITDYDTVLFQNAIEFLQNFDASFSLWDGCNFIFQKLQIESKRINLEPLELAMSHFESRLKMIKEKLQYTEVVEAFINSDFTISHKNLTKLEAAKKITKIAYQNRVDNAALVQAMCEILEVGAEKMKAIIKILNS